MSNHDSDGDANAGRRDLLKTTVAAAAGITLIGPILGVNDSEAAHAAKQIRKASIHPTGIRYGGGVTAGLSRAFAYDMLYDANGLKTGPGTTIGSYRDFHSKKGYSAATYGQWTLQLLQPSDWVGPDGLPIKPADYQKDAQSIDISVRNAITAALKANLDSAKPLPVFFFAGSSGMRKADDPTPKNGYRAIVAQGAGFDAKHPDQTYLILGTLCPLDA